MSRNGTYKGRNDVILTVPVSLELHRRLRIHLAEEGRTTKWLVTKLIEKHLASADWMKANGAAEDTTPSHQQAKEEGARE